jgi:ABC-type transport system involved in multi-copper enzyme maturation permease subunit
MLLPGRISFQVIEKFSAFATSTNENDRLPNYFAMSRIIVIAQNTFRESVRDKILYNLLFFVFLLIISSILIAELSLNQERVIIARMGLSVMLFFGMLIAIFIGTGLVYKEIEKRTIYAMLAKPISRPEFVLGKFFGLGATLFVNCVAILFGVLAALAFLNYVRYGEYQLAWSIIPAGYLIYLELLIIVAFAMVFSSFSTPALSVFFSIVLYLISTLSSDLLLFAGTTPVAMLKYVAYTVYYILPNLSNFNYITLVAQSNQAVPAKNLLAATGYAIVYTTLLLTISVTIFQRRNFK